MTLAIATRGYGLAWVGDYQPVNSTSIKIQAAWRQRRNFLQGSASDWLPSIEASMRTIRIDCTSANWDGSGAFAVSNQTVELAQRIAERLYSMLPSGTPTPDIVPEPDGEIGMSWISGANHMLSLSVGSHKKINFAAQFGAAGGIHGWRPVNTSSDETIDKSLTEVARHIACLFE